MNLSKSLYTRGIQCEKSLWLKKYKKDVLVVLDEKSQAVFSVGNKVGKLACELFPNGKEIPFAGTTFSQKISLTKEWIDNGIQNIYEATFEYDNILVMVDILHINDDGTIELYEVKSSTKVKKIFLHDVSIQYYVLKQLGYNIKNVSIIHINNKYIKKGMLDINKLFTISSVLDEIKTLENRIPLRLQKFESVLSNKINAPNIDIGSYCTEPYECDAFNYCWRDIPDYSVFNITRLKTEKKFELYKKGIIKFSDIKDFSDFSESQKFQIESEKNKKPILNKILLKDFLDTLKYPIYHLDFETFQQAIPEWDDLSPYMQIPFQFSLHIEYENGKLEHKEFLAKQGEDPRYNLAKHLIENIPDNVTVLTYNMSFEKGVIKKLAEKFTEFNLQLMKIHDNIHDLMIPFQKKYYYTPEMKGSYSIKNVLPALVPDMKNEYKDLKYVNNGSDAMQVYAKLSDLKDEKEIENYRNALLEYCKLDTLAMVKILRKLYEL